MATSYSRALRSCRSKAYVVHSLTLIENILRCNLLDAPDGKVISGTHANRA